MEEILVPLQTRRKTRLRNAGRFEGGMVRGRKLVSIDGARAPRVGIDDRRLLHKQLLGSVVSAYWPKQPHPVNRRPLGFSAPCSHPNRVRRALEKEHRVPICV